MRRNHLSLAPPLPRSASPSLTVSLFFFPFLLLFFPFSHSPPIYTCPLLPSNRIVRTPALFCRLEFCSFETSGSRQGTISPPLTPPSPCSAPHCFLRQYSPPPLRRHLPTLRILPFSLGLERVSPRSLQPPLFHSLRRSRRTSFSLLFQHTGESCLSSSDVKIFSCSHERFHRSITLPSLEELSPLSLPYALISVSPSHLFLSLKLLPPVPPKYLAETQVCLSSVFFSFACLLLSLFAIPTPLPSTTVDLLRFSSEEG